jgi:hypothetical protein
METSQWRNILDEGALMHTNVTDLLDEAMSGA